MQLRLVHRVSSIEKLKQKGEKERKREKERQNIFVSVVNSTRSGYKEHFVFIRITRQSDRDREPLKAGVINIVNVYEIRYTAFTIAFISFSPCSTLVHIRFNYSV